MARSKRKAVIDEVSGQEVTPHMKPRPRKKQAVTKTKSARIIALILQNAKHSPLFKLPAEVRENILIHLVGDTLIHLKYLDGDELESANKAKNKYLGTDASGNDGFDRFEEILSYTNVLTTNDNGHHDDNDDLWISTPEDSSRWQRAVELATPSVLQPTFRYAICVAEQSEQSAYDKNISGNAVVAKGELPEFYVASCEERHAACKMCGNGPKYLLEEDRQLLRIDLSVLGVCRQLYEEANRLLWRTNTFSFEDPKTFEKFIGSLNPAQKRKLTSIHINTDICQGNALYTSAYQRARWDSNFWGKALKMSNLDMLRGVQTLHLCINHAIFWGSGKGSTEQEVEKLVQAEMEIILRLRALSVKRVTVMMSDDVRDLETNAICRHRWAAIKKNKYAESIRSQLVDPSAAILVKTEAEAAIRARKIELRDNAMAKYNDYKSALKRNKADVARIAQLASDEEAKAVLATQEAQQLPQKPLNEAARLLRAAEKQKNKAVGAREAANNAVNKAKYWEEQVANMKEKYYRTQVRLGATAQDIEDKEEFERIMPGYSSSEMDISEDDASEVDENVQPEGNESMVSYSEDGTFDGNNKPSSSGLDIDAVQQI